MGTQFSITDNAVVVHGSNLDVSVAQLNANLAQFVGALEGLPAVWRGAAFQSFDQLQLRWQQASRDLNAALNEIRARVGSAGQLYDQYHAEQQDVLGTAVASANWDGAKFRA